MALLMLYGPAGNALASGGGLTVSSEDANYPKANAIDSYCDTVYREAAFGTDRRVYGDLSQVVNPGFEIGSTLSPWGSRTSGSGSVTRTTTAGEFDTGSAAMETTGGSGFAEGFQAIAFSPGAQLHYDIRTRVVTAGTARLRIRNRDTGRYWTGAAWSLTPSDAATRTGTTYGTLSGDFTLEDWSVIRKPSTTIELIGRHDNTTGSACWDNMHLWPRVNLMAVFGHNITVTPIFQSSDDGAAWTTEVTMAQAHPGFYGLDAGFTRRYAGLFLSGTGSVAHYIGELVCGYAVTISGARWEHALPRRNPAAVSQNAIGRMMVTNYTMMPSEGCRLEFTASSEAAAGAMVDEVWGGSAGGSLPVILVPLSAEYKVVHGRVSQVFDPRRAAKLWTAAMEIEGSAMPVIGL